MNRDEIEFLYGFATAGALYLAYCTGVCFAIRYKMNQSWRKEYEREFGVQPGDMPIKEIRRRVERQRFILK